MTSIAGRHCQLTDAPALQRQQEYFDRAKTVVDEMRGANAELERRFDELFRRRPQPTAGGKA
jgi:hypothetical protein